VLISATVLMLLALAMLLFNPAKVLATVFLLLVVYSNPITLLPLAVILSIFIYIRSSK
jgi:hypothetical protein